MRVGTREKVDMNMKAKRKNKWTGSLKNGIKKMIMPEWVLLAFVAFQLVYLFCFNIFRMRYAVNTDSSTYLVQVMQIWKQKTLFIDDYFYSTMLTWDMPTLLAVPFYGFFHDVCLAWGMANNVLIVLFALVLYKLCRDLEYGRMGMLLVFAAVFAVYQYGYVDYIEELFVNGALYGFRILYMLLLADVLICLHKHVPLRKNLVLYLLCLAGCFLCGISSGIFELGCCVLPFLLYEIWHVLGRKENVRFRDFFHAGTVCAAIAAVACMAGMAGNYLLGFSGSSAASKMTIGASEMADNVSGISVGWFQLFGWPEQGVVLTSMQGILAVAAFAIGVVVLLVFIGATAISVCGKGEREFHRVQKMYGQMVGFVFLVNLALFCLADLTYSSETCEYRYWLMAVIPIFAEIGMLYDWAKRNVKFNYRVFVLTGCLLLVMMVSAYKDVKMWQVDNGADGFIRQVNVAKEKGLDTVFVYGDYFSSRTFVAFSTESMEMFATANANLSNTGTWVLDELLMPRWGTYVKYDGDCARMEKEKRIGIFITPRVGEDYRFLRARAREVISFEENDYQLFLMDENFMDFAYGVPEDGAKLSRDYFNWGYEKERLVLNESGHYEYFGEADTILEGTFTAKQDGVYDMTLSYGFLSEEGETSGDALDEPGENPMPEEALSEAVKPSHGKNLADLRIFVTDVAGNTKEYACSMDAGETTAVIEGVELETGDAYTVSVHTLDNVGIELRQMEYQAR